MAVTSKHVSANLRITDAQNDFLSTQRNIDPNITSSRANALLNAFAFIRGQATGNAFLTVTTELTED